MSELTKDQFLKRLESANGHISAELFPETTTLPDGINLITRDILISNPNFRLPENLVIRAELTCRCDGLVLPNNLSIYKLNIELGENETIEVGNDLTIQQDLKIKLSSGASAHFGDKATIKHCLIVDTYGLNASVQFGNHAYIESNILRNPTSCDTENENCAPIIFGDYATINPSRSSCYYHLLFELSYRRLKVGDFAEITPFLSGGTYPYNYNIELSPEYITSGDNLTIHGCVFTGLSLPNHLHADDVEIIVDPGQPIFIPGSTVVCNNLSLSGDGSIEIADGCMVGCDLIIGQHARVARLPAIQIGRDIWAQDRAAQNIKRISPKLIIGRNALLPYLGADYWPVRHNGYVCLHHSQVKWIFGGATFKRLQLQDSAIKELFNCRVEEDLDLSRTHLKSFLNVVIGGDLLLHYTTLEGILSQVYVKGNIEYHSDDTNQNFYRNLEKIALKIIEDSAYLGMKPHIRLRYTQ